MSIDSLSVLNNGLIDSPLGGSEFDECQDTKNPLIHHVAAEKAPFEYQYPTQRFIHANGWDKINSGLKGLGVSMVHRNFFDRIWNREEPGFLGYHGSTQEYRIYQDIIRLLIEEKLKIPIREGFQFFRIPGQSTFDSETLSDYGDCVTKYSPTHFLCMNYALYGNFNTWPSCSYYYFANNASLTHHNYESQLLPLFEFLGIDASELKKAFDIGRQRLGAKNGVIMQLFDTSHYNPWKAHYELADKMCGGVYTKESISQTMKGVEPSLFYSQIRMLMSNKSTLNPFSDLVVKRYDTADPAATQSYEKELKAYLGNLEADPEKVAKYKAELTQLWGIDDAQL